LNKESIQKILVREVNWIGDVIFSLPALAALRKAYPKAKIAVLANGRAAGVLRENPLIDEIYTLGPKTGKLSLKNYWRSLLKIRAEKFDLAVLFPNSFRAAFDGFVSGIPQRVGFPTDARGGLLTHKVPLSEEVAHGHRVQYFLRIVEEVGAEVENPQLDLPLPEDVRRTAENFFKEHSLDRSSGVIAVHAGCSKFERSWHAERFAELSREMIQRLGTGIVLVGSHTEKAMLKEIAGQIGEKPVYVFTTFEPLELAAIIARANLFVGNDSGVSHLAEAVHTKLVVIYGSSAPWETGPFMPSSSAYRAVQKDYPCRPCRERFFNDCEPSVNNKPPCMEDITVENVLAAVEEIWELKKKNH